MGILGAVIFEIIRRDGAPTGLAKVGAALLAIVLLAVVGWWIGSWMSGSDPGPQAADSSTARDEGASVR
jgi:hypothetical protein